MFSKNDALTYEAFIREMRTFSNFSIGYGYGKLLIFYHFHKDRQGKNTDYMRNVLFTISTERPFELTAPAGFRLVQFKGIPQLSKVEQLALHLSRTPLAFRGELPEIQNQEDASSVIVRVNSLEEIVQPKKEKLYVLPTGELYLLNHEGKKLIKVSGKDRTIDLSHYAKKPEDVAILDEQLKVFIEGIIKE